MYSVEVQWDSQRRSSLPLALSLCIPTLHCTCTTLHPAGAMGQYTHYNVVKVVLYNDITCMYMCGGGGGLVVVQTRPYSGHWSLRSSVRRDLELAYAVESSLATRLSRESPKSTAHSLDSPMGSRQFRNTNRTESKTPHITG